MPKSQNSAPAAAPALFDLHTALTTECTGLRLIRNTLAGYVDVQIGEPVDAEMANDLGAATTQLRLVMERIERLADRLDELDVHMDLRPRVVALAGGGGAPMNAAVASGAIARALEPLGRRGAV